MSSPFPFGFLYKYAKSLYSFVFKQPRIDIAFERNNDGQSGRISFGYSQNQPNKIMSVPDAIHYFQFFWSYNILIKNNSSHTAYDLKVERIEGSPTYIKKIPPISTLKEANSLKLLCNFTHKEEISSNEAERKHDMNFPQHLNKIRIIISYTNEARKKFFTEFIYTKEGQSNVHLKNNPQ